VTKIYANKWSVFLNDRYALYKFTFYLLSYLLTFSLGAKKHIN